MIEEEGENNQGITGRHDQLVTTVSGSTSLVITCDVHDEGTAVYIDWGANDAFVVCDEDGPVVGPGTVVSARLRAAPGADRVELHGLGSAAQRVTSGISELDALG